MCQKQKKQPYEHRRNLPGEESGEGIEQTARREYDHRTGKTQKSIPERNEKRI